MFVLFSIEAICVYCGFLDLLSRLIGFVRSCDVAVKISHDLINIYGVFMLNTVMLKWHYKI